MKNKAEKCVSALLNAARKMIEGYESESKKGGKGDYFENYGFPNVFSYRDVNFQKTAQLDLRKKKKRWISARSLSVVQMRKQE